MNTNQTASTPAKSSSADRKIDAGMNRAYRTFGTDFQSFFASVLSEIAQRRERRSAEQQDTRFIKARDPHP
jgi:hypothetical protein